MTISTAASDPGRAGGPACDGTLVPDRDLDSDVAGRALAP